MLSLGPHTLESYAHILNTDKTVLKLNPTLEKFGYQFIWIDATEFELNFSEIFNVPKGERPLTIMIGREHKGISHELHNALVHTQTLGPMFLHMEYPGIILLRKLKDFDISSYQDFMTEYKEFDDFYPSVQSIMLQLRLFKIGEIRVSQLFHIASETRQISFRKREIEIGSQGGYTLTDKEAEELSKHLIAKYESTGFTDLAIKNFSVVYDLPDGKLRFITLMTCLESLFNLGKDQIAHTIARHLSLILSDNKEHFNENYSKIKKLYHKRSSMVHGSDYKGDLIQDYIELSDIVRKAITFCNVPGLTKEKLFEDLNSKGY
jgi:hypothetical protein